MFSRLAKQCFAIAAFGICLASSAHGEIPEFNGSISGTVFRDANGSAIHEFGEAGLSFMMIRCHRLDERGAIIETEITTTKIDGSYAITHLDVGTYRIEIEMPTRTDLAVATAHSTFSISEREPNAIAAFGVRACTSIEKEASSAAISPHRLPSMY
jgi:hypothetical protein